MSAVWSDILSAPRKTMLIFGNPVQKSVPKALPKRTFITEKQLKKMLEYRIPPIKNAQLTPLAQDYARTQKLLIKGEKACF